MNPALLSALAIIVASGLSVFGVWLGIRQTKTSKRIDAQQTIADQRETSRQRDYDQMQEEVETARTEVRRARKESTDLWAELQKVQSDTATEFGRFRTEVSQRDKYIAYLLGRVREHSDAPVLSMAEVWERP